MGKSEYTARFISVVDSSKERLNHQKRRQLIKFRFNQAIITADLQLWILLLTTSVISILSLTHPLQSGQEPESKPVAV